MSDYRITSELFSFSQVGGYVEPLRLRPLREGPPVPSARYVLYWMQINRRAESNPALSHAIERANLLGLPLVVYEGLRADYPAANDRIHTFILEGARERHETLRARGIRAVFYLQQRPQDHRDTLERLCSEAAELVTDHFPTFIIGAQTRKLLARTQLPVTAVDGSTIVPLRAFEKAEYAARTIRPKLFRILAPYLVKPYDPELIHRAPELPLPLEWETSLETPVATLVAGCQIDHGVAPSATFRGGTAEARRRLETFLRFRLNTYDTLRNDPAVKGTSELSPYLHFGMIGPHEVALAALGAGKDAENTASFLEELIIRRELSFNFCEFNPHFASPEGLPAWALKTLGEHAADPRPGIWTEQQVEQALTPDEVWNLAQRELLLTGKIHGYIRMLWGKKLLEHSPTPADAVRIMLALHDKYALDGRDPNTYVGVLWCLGLHDRAWGPPKPVIGLTRPMSSEAMRKKTDLTAYRRVLDGIARQTR